MLGGAAAMAITHAVNSNDDGSEKGAAEGCNAVRPQLVIPVDQLAGSDDERISAINKRTKQAEEKMFRSLSSPTASTPSPPRSSCTPGSS